MDGIDLTRFDRINVVGTAGSGKSTFARTLAEIRGLPYVEMDRLYWRADWQNASDDELLAQVREETSRPQWVLDGNYTRTTPEKWRRVQLVIWLDMSFPRTLFRVTRRSLRRGWSRDELWPGTGNRESLVRSFLTRESIIWWTVTSFRRNRRKYHSAMAAPEWSHVTFLRLSSPREVAACLARLRQSA